MAPPHPTATFDLSHGTVSLSVCLRWFVLTNVRNNKKKQCFCVDEIRYSFLGFHTEKNTIVNKIIIIKAEDCGLVGGVNVINVPLRHAPFFTLSL